MTRYRHLITDDNRKWWTLGAMCFALFMIMLDNTVVNVALPSIQRDLGASLSALEWTVNGYTPLLRGAAGDRRAAGRHLRPPPHVHGRCRHLRRLLGDRRPGARHDLPGRQPGRAGRRRRADDAGDPLDRHRRLPAARARQGDGDLGRASRPWPSPSAPVLGGFLTEHVSWRAIFYLNIPVAVGAVLAALFAVRESRDTTVGREVDYLGVATLTAALTALILALVEGNAWGWGSPQIVGLGVGAVVGICAFVAIELRVKAPMVEFGLLSHRNFLGAVVVALIVSFAMLGVFFFLALYMQNILGYSALEAGVRFLPSTLMIVVIAPVAGPARRPDRAALADRGRPRGRRRLALQLRRHRRRLQLRRAAARIHAARDRDRADDVADDVRGDERRRGREGGDRLRVSSRCSGWSAAASGRRHRSDLPGRCRQPGHGDAGRVRRRARARDGGLRAGRPPRRGGSACSRSGRPRAIPPGQAEAPASPGGELAVPEAASADASARG